MRNIRLILAASVASLMMTGAPAMAQRGSDGDLKLLFWQAVSTMNIYLSGGTKEQYASSMVIEPLAGFDEKGELVPKLVDTIPTVENGGVSGSDQHYLETVERHQMVGWHARDRR